MPRLGQRFAARHDAQRVSVLKPNAPPFSQPLFQSCPKSLGLDTTSSWGLRTQDGEHATCGAVWFALDFTLPKYYYVKPGLLESRYVLQVALHVPRELLVPEGNVTLRLRGFSTARMLMPKATMNEDDGQVPSENEVWLSRKVAQVEPVARSHCMQATAQQPLWLSIA